MPQSLSHIYLHLIFSTRGHHPFLVETIRPEIFAYMAKVLNDECASPAKIIGGVADHVHILFSLSRTQTAAHVAEMVKKRSSKWIKTKEANFADFAWQTGYGRPDPNPSFLPVNNIGYLVSPPRAIPSSPCLPPLLTRGLGI